MNAQARELNLSRDMEWIRNYVKSIVKRIGYCQMVFDMEDMYQEAYVSYLIACNTYNESKGAALTTYASKKIYWSLMDILSSPSMKEIANEAFFGLMDESVAERGTEKLFEECEDQVYMESFDEIFNLVYTKTKSKCIRMGIIALREEIQGKSIRECADRFKVTTSYMSVCKKRALEALEPYYEDIRTLLS